MDELSLHILDIVQNSISAKAKNIEIHIVVLSEKDKMTIKIIDDGFGMDAEFLRNVTDPYSTTRTTRKVGMGIPLFKQACEVAGGGLDIISAPSKGTTLTADFSLNSIDRMPLGDLGSVYVILLNNNTKAEITLHMQVNDKSFSISGTEIKTALQDEDTSQPEIVAYLTEMINENIKETAGGIIL